LFNLQWPNVDLERRQITISASSAKSRKSRSIPLNQTALGVLQDWNSQSHCSHSYVFSNRNGDKFRDIKTAWRKLLINANIENFRWHDLRHHFASKLAMAGVDLNTIRELLGHSSYEMTMRYAHLSDLHKLKAVAVLE